MSDGEHGGGSDWRRRFLGSSSSKSSSKTKSRKNSLSSTGNVKSTINRPPSSQSSRSILVSSPSPRGTNSEISDEDEHGGEMISIRVPSSTGSRTDLLRSGRSRTDSIREEDEGDDASEQSAESPSNNNLDGGRTKTPQIRMPINLKGVENQERRPSVDPGQGGQATAETHATPPLVVNKHKKLPTPLIVRSPDPSQPLRRDSLSRNASTSTGDISPKGGPTGTAGPSRSTAKDGLSKMQDTPAPNSLSAKRSDRIINSSASEGETMPRSVPLNSSLMLTKPNIEAKRKPSMNSIKEGIETPADTSEPKTAAGDAVSQGTSSDPRGLNKPNNIRSASALKINSMSNATSSTQATTKSTSNQQPPRERKPLTFEPPMPDLERDPDVEPAPPSGMYWSKAPCFGYDHNALRAHTTTLVGSNIYVFGGCDSHACFNDLYIFDADCMYWSAPECRGEKPPVLRAMTATAVSKKIVIFGGGDGPAYYNDVYVLDTLNLRYTKPRINGAIPSKRRAHTACLYKHGIYVFGGGDGVKALNDIWRLDVSDTTRMSWKLISAPSKSSGRPTARGYHTANMVGSKLIIFGGSDGLECFRDVWVFDVETQIWRAVEIKVSFPRLSHTATVIGSYLFVIGGHDGVEYSSDVLLLNLVTMQWDKRKVYGTPPSGRGYHGTVLHDSRLFVIGGFDGTTVFDDTYVLELAVNAYYSQISHFTVDV
ncbi:MAG: hypothetical protein M1816_001261 [Peltula sp. TS41687]|nr:MAG: hypothetical protein M1816_001261 [Peltula sp. TS41687]